MKRLAFLASYNGSSARAINDACKNGDLNAAPTLLITNNANANALNWAHEAGLETLVLPKASDNEIKDALLKHDIDMIILSGYMKLIGPKTIGAYPEKIINVHPALLPKYGGKGMYGSHVHATVKDNGDTKTGITIHYVDEIYDNGAIIAQKEVAVKPDDSADDIENNVKAAEPEFYVETLKALLN